MSLKLGFHGAAGTVTGSRQLLCQDDRKLLVDAGLFQGLKPLRLRNWERPAFQARSLERLLLTHAHIDHSGYLPRLVKLGFSGPVHCTEATAELAELLLLDSAKIQEEDAEYANRKGYSKHRPALPLYTSEDAQAALELLSPCSYDEWLELGNGQRARFHNAGHILGAGSLELRVETGGRELGLMFSGDVGRYDMPLHPDPEPPAACDVMVVESTYGDRDHGQVDFEQLLTEPLRECFERRGTVLIPSFAVGRAQLVTLVLRQLMDAGKLPEVPIHIDSPMAVNTTRLYSRFLDAEHLDAELVSEQRSRLFPRNVELHRSVDDSKALNQLQGPRVIISSSGMLAGGRVLHHLKRLLPKPDNLVVLVGYQAAGTRGRALLEGAPTLRIHGSDVPVHAQLLVVHGFSAHADRDGLARWVAAAPRPPSVAFITHGEPEAANALAQRLRSEQGLRCLIPRHEQEFDLLALLAEET